MGPVNGATVRHSCNDAKINDGQELKTPVSLSAW